MTTTKFLVLVNGEATEAFDNLSEALKMANELETRDRECEKDIRVKKVVSV